MSEHTNCPTCTCKPPAKPGSCVCDLGTWGTKTIPAVCLVYDGDGDSYCASCEHDEACHRAPEVSA